MSIKTWIHGSSGKMGSILKSTLSTKKHIFTYIGGSDLKFDYLPLLNQDLSIDKLAEALKNVDLILDFSSTQGNQFLLTTISQNALHSKAILIGTTAINENTIKEWQDLATKKDLKVLLAPNTSIGINVLQKLLSDISKILLDNNFDIEIIETHHKYKKDAPSGTAKLLFNSLVKENSNLTPVYTRTEQRQPNELGIFAVRGGSVFGEHQIRFLGEDEEICITHRAYSRQIFANGACFLAQWLIKQNVGFYTLENINII